MRKILGTLIVFTALTGSGCPFGSYCRPTETRCLGNAVEVCDSTEHWARVMPCNEISSDLHEQWMCCEISIEEQGQVSKEHTCLPTVECEKGGIR